MSSYLFIHRVFDMRNSNAPGKTQWLRTLVLGALAIGVTIIYRNRQGVVYPILLVAGLFWWSLFATLRGRR